MPSSGEASSIIKLRMLSASVTYPGPTSYHHRYIRYRLAYASPAKTSPNECKFILPFFQVSLFMPSQGPSSSRYSTIFMRKPRDVYILKSNIQVVTCNYLFFHTPFKPGTDEASNFQRLATPEGQNQSTRQCPILKLRKPSMPCTTSDSSENFQHRRTAMSHQLHVEYPHCDCSLMCIAHGSHRIFVCFLTHLGDRNAQSIDPEVHFLFSSHPKNFQ